MNCHVTMLYSFSPAGDASAEAVPHLGRPLPMLHLKADRLPRRKQASPLINPGTNSCCCPIFN